MEVIDFHAHAEYDFHLADHGIKMDPMRFRDDMLANGITKVCGSVIYNDMNNRPLEEYEHIIPKLNDQALDYRDMLGDFFVPGIHVHPDFVEMSCRELERCHAKGVNLVGELVPYMMKWEEYYRPDFMEIAEYAGKLGMVVNMHPSNLDDMEKLSASLPNVTLVWAHFVGYGWFEREIEMMRKYKNIYFDISAHDVDFDGSLRYAIDRIGYDRILFGTDYPGITPAYDIAGVMAEDLTDDEREAILYKNAKRILKL